MRPRDLIADARRKNTIASAGKVQARGDEIMKTLSIKIGLTAVAAVATACLSVTALAGEISGKIVWADIKNSALLLECQENDDCKDVGGKKGETYTLVIPDDMKKTVESWKEGSAVKATFEDKADGGRLIKAAAPK
ncbi:MAG: hypothetical protein EXQ86_05215 [Rhodospirillales bacterium]|nr:hypothetical protein [Rhodospirillales bacterium]